MKKRRWKKDERRAKGNLCGEKGRENAKFQFYFITNFDLGVNTE